MTTNTITLANIKIAGSIYNEIRSKSYELHYGNNAHYVRTMDAVIGITSWVQLISDVRAKKTKKQIAMNQLGLTLVTVIHNVAHMPAVQDKVKSFFK